MPAAIFGEVNYTHDLTAAELDRYKNWLKLLAEKATTESTLEECSDAIMSICKASSPVGKGIYESFSDDELKEILVEFHANNDRCPAQKEIYFIYRYYIRLRFGNWPWALQAAELKEKKRKSARKRNGRYRNAKEKFAKKSKKI